MNYTNRIEKLQKQLNSSLNCQAILVEDPINLYYLTGSKLSAGTLLVHEKGAHLFVDSRYYELCQKTAPCEVINSSTLSTSSFLSIEKYKFIQTIGFDAEQTSYFLFSEWQKKLTSLSKTLVPLNNPIKMLRMIKDDNEINLIRQAAHLGSKGFDFICTFLKEGVSEVEAAVELEIFWKKNGAKGLAFDPIIAFGPNGSMPHYRAGTTVFKKGMAALIDIGVVANYYHSDMTRMIFYGDIDPEIKKIHDIVEKAQQLAINLCKPGTLIGKLDQIARDYIMQKGYGDYFSHNLGHGLGLEIHEAPSLRQSSPHASMPLQSGMVITIEPGIYLPGKGGVRIEDTLLITSTSYENLTLRSTKPYLITS